MSFESFNLHPSIMSGVRTLGYVTPTPIQREAIPPIMEGRDVIGLAQTQESDYGMRPPIRASGDRVGRFPLQQRVDAFEA